MDIATATGMGPLIWGVVALVVVVAGAIVAGVDPELAEVYVGDPPWVIAGVSIVLVLLVTVATSRPELAHAMAGLLTP